MDAGCRRLGAVWSWARVDWDDLKFLLAVADGGGLAGAARNLKVDPSTVSRRISALEKALGTELVARTPEGMTMTPAGEQTMAAARQIETQLAVLADSVRGECGATEMQRRLHLPAPGQTSPFEAQPLRRFIPLKLGLRWERAGANVTASLESPSAVSNGRASTGPVTTAMTLNPAALRWHLV